MTAPGTVNPRPQGWWVKKDRLLYPGAGSDLWTPGAPFVGTVIYPGAGSDAWSGSPPIVTNNAPVIEFVDAAANSPAESLSSMPTHAAGDFLLFYTFRDGFTSAPALASEYTNIASGGESSCSSRLAYKVAASSSESNPTWSNATIVMCQVYRNVSAIGASARTGGTSANVSAPGITLQDTSGKSWVAFFGGHTDTAGTFSSPAGSYPRRASRGGGTAESGGYDTNGGVTSWAGQAIGSGYASAGEQAVSVELKGI